MDGIGVSHTEPLDRAMIHLDEAGQVRVIPLANSIPFRGIRRIKWLNEVWIARRSGKMSA
jgi:hypothetical protein